MPDAVYYLMELLPPGRRGQALGGVHARALCSASRARPLPPGLRPTLGADGARWLAVNCHLIASGGCPQGHVSLKRHQHLDVDRP